MFRDHTSSISWFIVFLLFAVAANGRAMAQNRTAAEQRVALAVEPMGRGVVALPVRGDVYVSWRLLRDDPSDVAFDVFRRNPGSDQLVKLNSEPLRQTTDFIDSKPTSGSNGAYFVRVTGSASGPAGTAQAAPETAGTPFLRIPLKDASTTFQKVGVADLNGDGAYDFVIKQPNKNIDPWYKYWHRSPGTYKLEAYLNDGTFLWQKDLGWAIEQGIWYSPWIAFDLNGDGRAEVAAKVGEGDPRDKDGHVTSGAEWLVVWDGMTGREIARTAWPDRADFPDYNRASRNQMAVAFLDGRHASLIALRGTYSRMRVDAYRLDGERLKRQWRFTNAELGREYQGQGAHFTLAADVDRDGRDEIILGSAVLDDNGKPLWTTGKGHPDAAYLTDVDPSRPGLEIAYVMETRQKQGGLCLADASTGALLWQLKQPTQHVHSKGLCADIDPAEPGMEMFGADSVAHQMTDKRWMFSADGRLLRSGTDLDFGFTVLTAYWDGDLQKEIVHGRITNYGGLARLDEIKGGVQLVADVVGDWREELITTVPGELRIYSTTLPAMDRRVCLMQDPIYRLATAMNAMGYTQVPTTRYCPESLDPNINLTLVKGEDRQLVCRVVVSAPLDSGLQGTLHLSAGPAAQIHPSNLSIDIAPGGRTVEVVDVLPGRELKDGTIVARLKSADLERTARIPLHR